MPDLIRRSSGPGTAAAALLAFLGASPAAGAGKVLETVPIAPGLDYARYEEEGLIAHVLKMDLHSKALHIRCLKARGKESVRALVGRVNDDRTMVIGALNGDFFRQESTAGIPYGVHVEDGRLTFPPSKRSMIGFGPANEPYIGIVTLRAKMTLAPKAARATAKWIPIDDVNVVEDEIPKQSGIYLYTPAYRDFQGKRANGVVAVIEAVEPALQVGDVCEGKVTKRVDATDSSVQVPETGCLLYLLGDAARSMMGTLKPGASVALKVELPPIAGGVPQAIGGGPRLVRDGKVKVEISQESFSAVHAMEISKRHPRSAIGYDRARGALYLVMVEGRHEESRGMTFGELATFLQRLGCFQAMAFDGGGSAAMYVGGRGMVSRSMGGFNQPEEREIANALLITMEKNLPPRPDGKAVGSPAGKSEKSAKTAPASGRQAPTGSKPEGGPGTGTSTAGRPTPADSGSGAPAAGREPPADPKAPWDP